MPPCRVQLPPHARPGRIEQWLRHARRRPLVAEDLDGEAVAEAGELGWDVTERHRFPDMVGIAAGSDPADHVAVMPDRLVADGVRAGVVDDEGNQAALRAFALLLHRFLPADEVVLLQIHETVDPPLEPPLNPPIPAR